MFQRVLIANRGEIAIRIIRACRELGIETVAVYSQADEDSLHARLADQAYCVGPAPSGGSYLNIPNIISTALLAEVDAIHPGYGYLSEQAHFAEICNTHGIKFIGPPVAAIEKMGDKAVARAVMQQAGLPVVPGSEPVLSEEDALAAAEEIGYPIMLKAASGGGGKGMRIVEDAQSLRRLFASAQAEAEASFGDRRLYLEKFIRSPRHIEVQILADEHGNVIHLGERECSLQRRHQKVLEEAPSPAVDAELRQRIGEAAVAGAKAVGYTNAGTFEFLLDADGNFYFMEMNTRIQVEHPVTEMVTGIDLVQEQLWIAAGHPLRWRQDQITWTGHAIECRINAEDPARGFMPSPGTIDFYHMPGGPGTRIDSMAYSGCVISPYYDSMIAKVICHAPDRQQSLQRMRAALDEVIIDGIQTNVAFHQLLLDDERVQRGDIATDFIDRSIQDGSLKLV